MSAATSTKTDAPITGPPEGSDPLTWAFYPTSEVQTPTSLEVEGTIPSWITGSLYRGGAGTWDVAKGTSEHWFDGFSRNHRFEIANGSVSYRSRDSTDELTNFVRETGLYPGGAFGGDPCKIVFGAFEVTYRDGTNPRGDKSAENVGVSYVNNYPGLPKVHTEEGGYLDTLVVTTDGSSLLQINPITLEPIELFKPTAFDSALEGTMSAAHPAILSDGSVYNYVLDYQSEQPTYRVFGVFAPEGKTRVLATITDAPPAYIHGVFNTEKHIILIIWQADLTEPGKTILSNIGPWNPDRPAYFYVIDRFEGGIVSKYATKTFFGFHQINSFEDEEGNIFIDLPRMDDLSFIYNGHMENLRTVGYNKKDGVPFTDLQGEFTRYRLPYHGDSRKTDGPLVTHEAKMEFALPVNIELPRINDSFQGKPYRYAWGIHVEKEGFFSDSLIKVDTKTKTWKVWEPTTPHMPTEPIFIPTPGADREDDGVIITVALDAKKRHSSLLFLDATSMEEIARAHLPLTMSFGFHGTWGGSSQ